MTNKLFQVSRDLYCAEDTLAYSKEAVAEIVDYLGRDDVQKVFSDFEPTLAKTFKSVIDFQNVTSRPQGSPAHRGLNFDGLVNFCIRSGILPEYAKVGDVVKICKTQLSDREFLPISFKEQTFSLPKIDSMTPRSL